MGEERESTPLDRVYYIVSRVNGKPISKNALEYLQRFKESFLFLVAKKLKPAAGKVSQVEDAKRAVREIKTEEKKSSADSVQIEAPLPSFGTVLRAARIKEKLPQCKSIASLKEGEECTIFGVVYLEEHKKTEPGIELGIENEEGSVLIGDILTDALVAPGICAAFRGRASKGKFTLAEVVYPTASGSLQPPLPDQNILFFSGAATAKQIEKVGGVIEEFTRAEITIGLVVLMVEDKQIDNVAARIFGVLGGAHAGIKFILVPNTEGYFYPSPGRGKKGNVIIAGNPISIHIGAGVFLVGRFNLTDGLRGRYKAKGEIRKEISKAMLSQMSYNPFISYVDLSYLEEYSGVIIGDKYDTYAYKEKGKVFGLCGGFDKEEEQFLFYSAEKQELEVSALNGG